MDLLIQVAPAPGRAWCVLLEVLAGAVPANVATRKRKGNAKRVAPAGGSVGSHPMQPRRIALRLVRTLAAPVLLALQPLFWVADATRRASYTTLGRDQGIFQYIAWAIGRGERDYGDIRDVNGPLTTLLLGLGVLLVIEALLVISRTLRARGTMTAPPQV